MSRWSSTHLSAQTARRLSRVALLGSHRQLSSSLATVQNCVSHLSRSMLVRLYSKTSSSAEFEQSSSGSPSTKTLPVISQPQTSSSLTRQQAWCTWTDGDLSPLGLRKRGSTYPLLGSVGILSCGRTTVIRQYSAAGFSTVKRSTSRPSTPPSQKQATKHCRIRTGSLSRVLTVDSLPISVRGALLHLDLCTLNRSYYCACF